MKSNKSWLFLGVLILSWQAQAIVGGVFSTDPLPAYLTAEDRAKIQSHTVVVLNSQNPGNHSRCTGTLIAPNVVLTAAHCVPQSLENFFIVPSIYEFAASLRKPVVQVIVHEKYKSFDLPKLNQPNFDLALLKFAGDLPADYRPTSWINSFSATQDRFWLYVAGYGMSDESQSDTGEIRFSKVTIENALFLSQQSYLQGNQNNGEGICKGDSGGPAYMKIQNEFYVLGIVSAIVGGCTGTSYFNKSLFYHDWIQSHLSQIRN